MHNLSIIMSILCIILGFLCLPALFVKGNINPKAVLPGGMAVVCAVINFFTAINTDYDATWKSSEGKLILITFGLVIVGFLLYMVGVGSKLPVTDETKQRLYNECKKIGVNNLKTEANRKKAQMVAKGILFPANAIEEAFEYGLKIDAEKEAMKVREELQKKRDNDYQRKERLEKYVSYSGTNKRRAMLEDRLKKCREALKENEKTKNYYSAMGKGADPYVVGGIASAIGGAGAGLYAAAETSIKNAQNERDVALVKGMGIRQAYDVQSRRQEEEKQIQEALNSLRYKLVSEHTSEECFSRLSFLETKVSVTEAGSCIVDTDVKMDFFNAIEGVSTVIDGSILGKVYDNDKQIGTATLVFGEMGVAWSEKQHIAGIALFCGEKGKNYRVEFAPNRLWAMEK